ncbi:MAG: creatininase family protein [Chitinivibrionales bacterium]|nr:creatininase family protein [Chitinivibrionales bacterium]
MNWERLTAPQFEQAVEACARVCLLPIGVIEKHGDHLPLGQDTLYIHDVCSMAGEQEPAMVFPPYYFGQILEARHVPGTVAIRSELLLPLLENVCDEIGRNGFTRVVIVNGHGGNTAMLRYFCMTLLEKDKPYVVIVSELGGSDEHADALREAKVDAHGGESETCSMLHLRPELVKTGEYGDYGLPLKRLERYGSLGLTTGIGWYADFPGHFAGDKVRLTKKKGEAFVKAKVRRLVEQIRLIKSDDTPSKLYREYLRRSQSPANRYP